MTAAADNFKTRIENWVKNCYYSKSPESNPVDDYNLLKQQAAGGNVWAKEILTKVDILLRLLPRQPEQELS